MRPLVLLSAFGALVLAPHVSGQPGGSASDMEGRVGAAVLAAEVAAYGRAHGSPEALLAAARLLTDAEVVASPGEDGTAALSARALLDEASALDEGGAYARAIAALRTAASGRGARGGPRSYPALVPAHAERDLGSITFEGGAEAILVIRGDGGTDVDYFLYDESGALFRQDLARHDRAYWRWYVPRTETYRLVARNLGPRRNTIEIVTN